jgi:hypothetical protein
VLQVANRTPFATLLTLLPDPEGVDTLFTIVKATYALTPVRIADEQVRVTLASVFHGDPADTSVRIASDISLMKPATDLLILGHAHARDDRATAAVDVSLSIGGWQKRARVFGDRFWESNGVTHSITPPTPFVTMPLVWERAFGGVDDSRGTPAAEARNPVGVGFRGRHSDLPIDGAPVPNVEDPLDPITSPGHAPAPVGFAPISGHWEPRRSFAGTYDSLWERDRAPFLPEDFDSRFLQIAPPDLVLSSAGLLGAPVELAGLTPERSLRFQIPTHVPRITYRTARQTHDAVPNLDTLIIEPDAGRLIIVWRAAWQCDKRALTIREVLVTLPASA